MRPQGERTWSGALWNEVCLSSGRKHEGGLEVYAVEEASGVQPLPTQTRLSASNGRRVPMPLQVLREYHATGHTGYSMPSGNSEGKVRPTAKGWKRIHLVMARLHRSGQGISH